MREDSFLLGLSAQRLSRVDVRNEGGCVDFRRHHANHVRVRDIDGFTNVERTSRTRGLGCR